ncbi:MAG TPA: MaoC family dehydratase [bacterium]|nr:MaoC family dehydratase [bacterium]
MSNDDPIGPLHLRIRQSARLTKTVTDSDLRSYAEITGDYNPLHFSDDFAAHTRFGRRVAQGGIAAGLLNALVAMELPGPGTVFMSQSLNYRRPVFVGDTITATAEVLALKSDKPVCQLSFTVTNQNDEVVLEADAWTYTLRPDLERLGT